MKAPIVTWSTRIGVCLVAAALQLAGRPSDISMPVRATAIGQAATADSVAAGPASASRPLFRITLANGAACTAELIDSSDHNLSYIDLDSPERRQYSVPRDLVKLIEPFVSARPLPDASAASSPSAVPPSGETPAETLGVDETSVKKDTDLPPIRPFLAPSSVTASARQFHPSTTRTRSMGLESAYIYYKEMDLMAEKIASYIKDVGAAPTIVRGEPKSTEHGYMQGISYAVTTRIGTRGAYIRPSVSPLIGVYTTYDGSSQGDTISDRFGNIVGMEFEPIMAHKVNIFLNGGLIIGYQKPQTRTSFGAYSGLRLKLWYRSMNDLDASNDNPLSMAETYFWASLPLGLSLRHKVNEQWRLGADLSMDCMFYGSMAILASVDQADVEFDYPTVILGNKAGYRLELSAEARVSPGLALRITPYLSLYGFGKSNTRIASVEYQGSRQQLGEFFEPTSGTILGGLSFTFDVGADW